MGSCQKLADGFNDLFRNKRFEDVTASAALCCGAYQVLSRVAGDHHDMCLRMMLVNDFEGIQAIHDRHIHVKADNIRFAAIDDLDGALPIRGLADNLHLGVMEN